MIDNTFIQIIPEKINIENYSKNQLNKTFIISNNCNISLLLYLSPSDSDFIFLKDSSIRIGPKSKKKISFSVMDKYYKNITNNKTLLKPKKLYIMIKNDIIDEKIEIILSYYSKKNILNTSYNKVFLSPKVHNNINTTYTIPFLSQSNKFELTRNLNYEMEVPIQNMNLNDAVLDLKNKVLYLKNMLEKSEIKIKKLEKRSFFGKLKKINSDSFCIKGNHMNDIYINKLKNNRINYGYLNNNYQRLKNDELNMMVENKLREYELGLESSEQNNSHYNYNDYNK